MNKFFKLFFSFSLLCSFSFASNLTILEQIKVNETISLKDRLDDIYLKSQSYLFQTADINISQSDLVSFFSLSNSYFNNFENNPLSFSLDSTNNIFYISNTLGSSPSQLVIDTYLSNSSPDKLFSSNNNYDVSYYLDSNSSNFISLINRININPNIVISQTQPADTTKTWYKPLGNGSFQISTFSSGSWLNNGSSDPINLASVQVDDLSKLNNIACILNDKGFVTSPTFAESYLCSATNTWVKISSDSSSSNFNGDSNLLEMASTLMTSSGGSIADSQDYFLSGLKNIFSGTKTFTKKDIINTQGYWVDDTNNIFVTNSFNNIISKSFVDGNYLFIPNSTNTKLFLFQRVSNQWLLVSDGYPDVVQQELKTFITFDKKNNQFFKYINDYWFNSDISGNNLNSIYLTSNSSGRSIFPAPSSTSVKYLTLTNDCLSSSCNGLVGTNYFAGEQLDSMYVYYYSTSGKRENNLIDAIPSVSITDTYNRGLLAGLVGNTVYIKALDTLNRTCYQSVVNNGYYTKNGVLIPTGNNLPNSVDCSTATYSGNYLILNTRTNATDWTTAPNNALVYLTTNSTNYAHILSGSLDFWTNNGTGDGQASATEIFTGGSRTSFPVVTHTINALTKLVDTPNNTGTGLVSGIDNSFKMWYYAAGVGVKNLTDAILISSQPYNSANTVAQSVGWASYGGSIFYKSGSLWKYQSNNTNWNPCGLLSNTNSYTNWSPDYTNLKCDRTIMTYTPKVNQTITSGRLSYPSYSGKSSYPTYSNKLSYPTYANKSNNVTFSNKLIGYNYANKVSNSTIVPMIPSSGGFSCEQIFLNDPSYCNGGPRTIGRLIRGTFVTEQYYILIDQGEQIHWFWDTGTEYGIWGPVATQKNIYSTNFSYGASSMWSIGTEIPKSYIFNGLVSGTTYGNDRSKFLQTIYNYNGGGVNKFFVEMSSINGIRYTFESFQGQYYYNIISPWLKFQSCQTGSTYNGTNCTKTTLTCPGGYPIDNGSNCAQQYTYCDNANGWYDYNATQCYKNNYYCDNASGWYNYNATQCYKTIYYCDTANGYWDNGANCGYTNYYCDNASGWYNYNATQCYKTNYYCDTANGWNMNAGQTQCEKVIQVCPDASWTDNGTNCRKQVPETQYFNVI